MTEKRFREVVSIKTIKDNQTGIVYTPCLVHDDFLELVNNLAEENEELKQINHNLGDFRNFITEQNVLNEKQRKELQLQMLRLYNYFENYFEDTMSPNAFSEMWDNVKDDEKWD